MAIYHLKSDILNDSLFPNVKCIFYDHSQILFFFSVNQIDILACLFLYTHKDTGA